jgi:hypothetical protein
VHNSRTGFWRLAGRCRRPIGVAASPEDGTIDGCEYVAASARDRLELDDGYRPPNLVDYLAHPEAAVEPVPEEAWPAVPAAGPDGERPPLPHPLAKFPHQREDGQDFVARSARVAAPSVRT